ncbi:MAG: glycine cleavage system aminomethyltransferase GcvT [Saprospiraceae bacterium]|nr:glycine cleavage system aminomethyltransferase GcvT [Saprospiraceae bacterium]
MTETREQLKYTPLASRHEELGARMTGFAGYYMPVVYSTIQEEHLAVRKGVGIFDVSHMGEFIVRGKEALDLIQLVTSNDAAKLEIGDAQYSCMPNHHGGIVDDLLVYRLPEDMCAEGEQAFMLVVNASNIQKDWDWIQEHNQFDTDLIDISGQTGLLAVQGPGTTALLQSLTDVDLASIPFYKFKKGTFAGKENVLISATGYTGSGGFELYARDADLPEIWDAIFAAGPVTPAGLGARDTLRLEMGYCLYGNDIDDSTSPLEAGLGWITKTKKDNFNSVEFFRAQRENGVDRKLVGFVVDDRRVPRHNYPIEDGAGNPIGRVTSGTLSPCLQKPIGMGYVHTEFATPGTEFVIRANRKELPGRVVKLPFYQRES